MIVDDHPLFRAGLQKSLEYAEDMVIVGSADNGEQALVDAPIWQPDVVLLDINMPRLNGLQVTRKLRQGGNRFPYVIILTGHHDDEQLLYSFSMGDYMLLMTNL
jgi:two-component system, NarL family, response regulator DegU